MAITNLKEINKGNVAFPEMRLSSGFISYPDRGEGGKSSWRGNFSPKLVEDIINQFQPKRILDPMAGSGTTQQVAARMGVENFSLDLNPRFGGFDLVNDDLDISSDMIIWHPPYWNIIQYSGKEWGTHADPRDLSRAGTWEQFISLMNKCTAKLITALRKGGRMAVLVGDIKKKGCLYSMLKSMDWYGVPENVVPKFQHNASSFSNNYGGKFIPITCEYLLIFKRDDCYVLPAVIGRGIEIDLRKSEKITWRDVVHSAMERLGGHAHLQDLYREIEGHAKTKKNQHWKEKVRQVLETNKDFTRTGRGEWCFVIK